MEKTLSSKKRFSFSSFSWFRFAYFVFAGKQIWKKIKCEQQQSSESRMFKTDTSKETRKKLTLYRRHLVYETRMNLKVIFQTIFLSSDILGAWMWFFALFPFHNEPFNENVFRRQGSLPYWRLKFVEMSKAKDNWLVHNMKFKVQLISL